MVTKDLIAAGDFDTIRASPPRRGAIAGAARPSVV